MAGSVDELSFGPGGGLSRFSAYAGPRSLTGTAPGAIRYPSPFFDIAHTYLPHSFKTMLRWCRYYFLTNPIINCVVTKMAEYPVTDLVFDSENDALKERWEYLFKTVFSFKKFEVEVGLDYGAYGNAFVSISYPFKKFLICPKCGFESPIDRQKYVFRDYQFAGHCQRCNHYGDFKVKDYYIRSVRDIKLVRWNPEQIAIHHNDATGETQYFYTLPATLQNDIRMAKRFVIEQVPQVFIEALKHSKSLVFNKNQLYHLKRPTIAQKDKGWGLPMILPVLKDAFYLQILRKAQEAISIDHVVPLRILFPVFKCHLPALVCFKPKAVANSVSVTLL